MIVGRDTGSLDEAGVARAGIESLAESFCDGIVAPLFWFMVLGLPGIWAYKAINTADSLIGHPEEHIFLKPRVTQAAARQYAFDFRYQSRPNWDTYQSLLEFAEQVRRDQRDLKPRDMIDLQGFIWVLGSDEYPW